MTLSELQNELDTLLASYIRQEQQRLEILKGWLKAQNLDSNQILLLRTLAIKRLQEQIISVSAEDKIKSLITDKDHLPTKNDFQIETERDFEPYLGKYDDSCDSIYEFLKDLTVLQNPLEHKEIDFRIVRPDKVALFRAAELWARRNEFIDSHGQWTKPLRQLAGFLGALIELGIIEHTTKEHMDTYFGDRYNLPQGERMGDQAKASHIKTNNQTPRFTSYLTTHFSVR